MEAFLDTLGAVALIALVVVGLAAGAIAGAVAGRNRILYLVLGVVGAVALPFILAALGVTVVAAGGLLLLLVVAAIGAALVLALVAALRRELRCFSVGIVRGPPRAGRPFFFSVYGVLHCRRAFRPGQMCCGLRLAARHRRRGRPPVGAPSGRRRRQGPRPPAV